MKHTSPQACLSLRLLRYVRDRAPTEAALLDWLGPSEAGVYYVLCKAGLLREAKGRIVLSPDHCAADGRSFRFENHVYLIDDNQILTL